MRTPFSVCKFYIVSYAQIFITVFPGREGIYLDNMSALYFLPLDFSIPSGKNIPNSVYFSGNFIKPEAYLIYGGYLVVYYVPNNEIRMKCKKCFSRYSGKRKRLYREVKNTTTIRTHYNL